MIVFSYGWGMDLRQIRYFVGIVECGSLTRAAQEMNVAQPALSQHLKRLEEDLGQPLLLRTRRGVVPTEAGRILYERGRSLLGQMEVLREDLLTAQAEPRGQCSVGIPTSLGAVLSVPLAAAIRHAFPQIRLRVVEGLSGHMAEWLRAGRLDLALIFGDSLSGLACRMVATEDLRLVMAGNDPRRPALLRGQADGAVAFHQVAELPLILPGRPHGVREEVEVAARQCGVTLDVVLEMDALESIRALVAAGLGYTVLSGRVAHGGGNWGLVSVPIQTPAITRTIQLAHVAERPLSNAALAVERTLLAQLAKLVDGKTWRDETF